MKRLFRNCLPFLAFLFFVYSSSAQTIDWPKTTQESKPWTRWWWPNNAVDKENIKVQLKEFADAGIGGVEITSIYGVKGEDASDIEYLSPEFTEVLKFTIEEANKLGLGVDLPPGSGWRCGGTFVPEENGLWNLQVKKQELKAGKIWTVPKEMENVAAVSFVAADGERQILESDKNFKAEKNGTVYVALRVKSGDKVKRPSKGGEGWTIDTFNKEITEWYLNEFWQRLGIDEGMLRCFFHDSFEYTGDFTTHFIEEFKKRRGYDLAEYLNVLAGDCDDEIVVARVKSDYRATLSDLVLESFIEPMTVWANNHKSLNRNQAHGSPGNILDLYAACDIPETEIFRFVEPGTVDVFVNKFASSSAHVTGQKLVSSESFTWLKEHWTVTTSDMVRATNRFFLGGINHMFFHGTCYSPEDDQWPGWLFYASTQMNNRNPLWREMPTLHNYIGRSQSVLQAAQQNNDVLIYWPFYDVAAGGGKIFNHLGVNKDAGWFKSHPISELSENLMDEGYTFDYISDKQLLNCKTVNGEIATSGGANYKSIIIPKTEYIPLETIKMLAGFISEGGKVYFDEYLPESVPGMYELEKRELELDKIKTELSTKKCMGDVVNLLTENKVLGEKSLVENNINFLKMTMNDEDWYMVFNTGTEAINKKVKLNSKAKSYVFMNPMTGDISRAEADKNGIWLQLEVEQSMFIKCTGKAVDLPIFAYKEPEQKTIKIGALWKLEFMEGGPVYPGNLQTDELISWTKLGDQESIRFAGTARYSTEFNWDGEHTATLNLGKVKDCARVTLNGKVLGTLLGPGFQIKLKNLVKGNNKLQIEVTNVAANRIRDLDIRGIEWRKFKDINFVNIDYKPFDASGWEIKDAGLLGPITITEL